MLACGPDTHPLRHPLPLLNLQSRNLNFNRSLWNLHPRLLFKSLFQPVFLRVN